MEERDTQKCPPAFFFFHSVPLIWQEGVTTLLTHTHTLSHTHFSFQSRFRTVDKRQSFPSLKRRDDALPLAPGALALFTLYCINNKVNERDQAPLWYHHDYYVHTTVKRPVRSSWSGVLWGGKGRAEACWESGALSCVGGADQRSRRRKGNLCFHWLILWSEESGLCQL